MIGITARLRNEAAKQMPGFSPGGFAATLFHSSDVQAG
jgi:hypothetical protein